MSDIVLCLCGPGGCGKSSLAAALVEQVKDLSVSVSTTTRDKRKGEVEGTDYFFVSKEEFRRKIDAGDFLEHAVVADNYYGTEKIAVKDEQSIVLDIDWQGAREVKTMMPSRVVVVLVLPPSVEELKSRLKSRGRDSDEVISKRMKMAQHEISELKKFSDYFVCNDVFETALSEVKSIYTAETLRMSRQSLDHF